MISEQIIKKLLLIIGLIFIIQFVVIEAEEADPFYRIFNSEQPCNGEECLFHNFKRSPNELILNRDNLVTLLRHMYQAMEKSLILSRASFII